jgi:glycine oxidase
MAGTRVEPTLVVGAGIAGAAVALSLRERGQPVLVLEARSAGGAPPALVTTAASAGMLAPQFESSVDDATFRLAVASRDRHPDFLRRVERLAGVDLGLRRSGMLVAAFDAGDEEALAAETARQRELGLAAAMVDPREAARLQPGVGPGAIAWQWLPDEASLDTQRLAAALPVALEAAGSEVRHGCRVARILTRGGAVSGVEVAGGETLAASRVVLAAGAWTGLIEGLPAPVPVRPVRGQMLRYEPAVAPPLERLVAERRGFYLVPRPDGGVLAGSTMEEASFEAIVTGEGTARIRAGASRLVPSVAELTPTDHWAGLRPVSADGAPILGPDPALEGLFYATGYGRNGILLAPAAGAIVATQLVDGEIRPDWRVFSIARFSGP